MSDTINRQAAIMKILGQPPELHYPSWYAEQIKELPPADEPSQVARDIARIVENEKDMRVIAQPDTYWKEQCQSYEQTINKLRESLSAKSESFEWCTDCKEYDQEKHCCPRWNKVIKKTIDEMKPEIVHCGECKHYVFVDDRMDMFPIRGCSVTGFRDVDAGDFCSRAERREETE